MDALLAAAEAAGATALAEEISPTWDGAKTLELMGFQLPFSSTGELIPDFWMPSISVLVCDFVFLEWGFFGSLFLAEFVGWWWWGWSFCFCPDLGENGWTRIQTFFLLSWQKSFRLFVIHEFSIASVKAMSCLLFHFLMDEISLEGNHLKNGGSFRMMINHWLKNGWFLNQLIKRLWPRTSRVFSQKAWFQHLLLCRDFGVRLASVPTGRDSHNKPYKPNQLSSQWKLWTW